MSPMLIKVTRAELLERRKRVLDNLDLDLNEFRARIARGALHGDEWFAAEDLNEIDFLLGDEEG